MPDIAAALKRLEVAWRGLWIRALTRLMRRDAAGAPLTWDDRSHRVLFLRHDRIGDMIMSTGLLRVIATAHPTIRLHVLASPANAVVLQGDPHVESVIVFDRTRPRSYLGTLRRLRAARYDAVIDCMPTAPSLTTLLLIWASGARHRIGVAGRGNDAAFTVLVPALPNATHIIDHLAALAAAFDVDPARADFRPRLYVTDAELRRAHAIWRDSGWREGRRRLLVNISAGRAFRRWPDDRYVRAIRHVRAKDPHAVVSLVGAPNERERASEIARAADAVFVPTPALRDALALVAAADLVFSPDTGLAHAAAAVGRPVVVMYIRGVARVWGLYGAHGYELSSQDATLTSLPIEPVLEALDRLLAAGGECNDERSLARSVP
jgi:ADP-heptose:LPS heptosyltransferase